MVSNVVVQVKPDRYGPDVKTIKNLGNHFEPYRSNTSGATRAGHRTVDGSQLSEDFVGIKNQQINLGQEYKKTEKAVGTVKYAA